MDTVTTTIVVKIIDMKDSNIKTFNYDGRIFKEIEQIVDDNKKTKEITKNRRNKNKRYTNLFDRWIKKENITKFTLKDFIDVHPKYYYREKLLNTYISQMLSDKTISQITKDTFVVNKNINDDDLKIIANNNIIKKE